MVAPQTDVDIAEEVRRLNRNISLTLEYLDNTELRTVDSQIQAAVQSDLVKNFQYSIDSIEEYYSYEPLIDHLMGMVRWGPHVRVYNGEVIQVWDADYAGTYEDLKAGQIAAGADFSKEPAQRSIGWKIIYDAAIHGVDASKYWKAVDSNTYAEIIEARLSYWGEKAPYWIFVEWGTNAGDGPGTSYPSFSGKNPIERTRGNASRIGQEIIDLYLDSLERTIVTLAEERFVDDDVYEFEIEVQVETAWTITFQQYGKNIQREYFSAGGGFTGKWREVSGP